MPGRKPKEITKKLRSLNTGEVYLFRGYKTNQISPYCAYLKKHDNLVFRTKSVYNDHRELLGAEVKLIKRE